MTRILLASVASILLAALFGHLARRFSLRRRFARGAEAEREALHLARQSGFRVLATQVAGTATIVVDGQPLESPIRADMLLSRWGRRYIGEVKSGRQAPDPTDRNTRRQLLEYSQAFEADGLLLFDMQAHRIRRIDFPRGPRGRGWARVALGLVVGLAAGWLLREPEVYGYLRALWTALGPL